MKFKLDKNYNDFFRILTKHYRLQWKNEFISIVQIAKLGRWDT